MHYLYILKSDQTEKYYIGETSDIEKRLKEHLSGKSSFGKRNKELQLAYKKEFHNRSEARKIESFLKRQKSRLFIEKFIAGKISFPL